MWSFSRFISLLFVIHSAVPLYDHETGPMGHHRQSLLSTSELVCSHGYHCEEHEVETEDGYLLRVFTVRRNGCMRRHLPLVIVHGLLQNSDSWLDAGPGYALGYLLADACHEVWLQNTRGSYYSRRHRTLQADSDPAFWRFSFDEIAYYDLPALLSYVLRHSGAHKLNYIGFSQGGGSFFAMCSERPEYCDKVNFMVALAPATRMYNTKSIPFRKLAKTIEFFETQLLDRGIYEIMPRGGPTQKTLEIVCQTSLSLKLCEGFKSLLSGITPSVRGSINSRTMQNLIQHFPAGTSTRNIVRYSQSIRNPNFVKFDYGKATNLQFYNRTTPPKYNFGAVKVPVVVIYGKNDGIVDAMDVEWATSQLPNVVDVLLIEDPLFDHLDMTYSQFTGGIIVPVINRYLSHYNYY